MAAIAHCPRLRHGPSTPTPPRRVRPRFSLVAATLSRNGARGLERGAMTEVPLDGTSRIVRANGGRVWCRNYAGLAGLFRKDRGPSKELGRALCDEVKERFGCDGFLTTDELPRYGITRRARRTIQRAAGAGSGDCVVVYAYDRDLANRIDQYLHSRLREMR